MKPKPTLRSFLIACNSLLVLSSAHAATLTWDAGGAGGAITNGGGAWLGANLWNDGGAAATWTSGDDAIFAGPATAGGAVTLASPTTVGSLTFNPSFTGIYTLGTAGQAITLNSGITLDAGSGAATFVSPITLGGTQTWTNHSPNNASGTSGSLNINSTLDLNGNALTIGGSRLTSFGSAAAAVISGAGGINATGGRLWLGAGQAPAHTYSGDTTITGGAVVMISANASPNSNINLNGGVLDSYWTAGLTRTLGTGGNQVRITGGESGFGMNGNSGATFNLGASITWGDANFNPSKLLLQTQFSQGTSSLNFSSAINLDGADRTVVASSGLAGTASSTLSGNLTNGSGTAAGLIKEGAGLLSLSGTNTYDGNTTISAGILKFAKTVSMPSTGNVTVNSGATVAVDVGQAGEFTGATSGAGSFGGLLAGTGVGSSTVTYSGDVGVGIDITGTNVTYAGDIANPPGSTSLSLFKINGNNLTLTGNNTYTGKTVLAGGSVLVGSFGNVGDTSSPLGTNSTIEFRSGGNLSFIGTTVQSSDKTLDIAQADATLRADGTGVGTITLSSNINPTSTGTKSLGLFGANTNANTISGNISNGAGGTLAITKNLAGTWVLSGTNTYTGATTLSGGTLVLAGSGALPSGSQLVWGAGGTTLQFQNDANHTVTNTLNWSVRNTTRTLLVDRLTAGSSVDLSINIRPNLDCSSLLNLGKGSNITSGTPTITFAGGTGSTDSNNGTIGGAANFGPVTFNPTGVNVVINNGITSSARTRGYIFQGDSTGNQVNGVFQNGSGTEVVKRGSGTWTFTGANLYTLGTTVEAGTLLVNNTTGSGTGTGPVSVDVGTLGGTGTISGAVTIGDGTGSSDAILAPGTSIESLATGNLTFDSDGRYAVEVNGTAATSDQTLVTGTVTINAATTLTANVTGTLADGQKYYIVVNDDTDAVSGTFAGLAQNALVGTFGGLDLKISYTGDSGTSALSGGNDIVLYAENGGGGSPYENWATGGELFEDDANNDGVSNGLAFLLGAPGPNVSALDKLPTITESAGGLVLVFDMLDAASRGTATLSVEHSSDLGVGDPWEAALVPDADNTVNDVVFDIQGTGTLGVEATIPVSKAAAGRLFGRLKATE